MMGFLHLFAIVVILVSTVDVCVSELKDLLNSAPKGQLLTPEQGCGFSTVPHKRIVGGSPAKPGAWPWIALIKYTNGHKTIFGCGGSLITTRHVLTAAHCVMTKLKISVRLGEHDITDEDTIHKDIRVIRAARHSYFDNYVNDIGILYLEHDVEFTEYIRPICLPFKEPMRSRRFTDQNPYVVGWGLTKEGGEQSNVLLELQVPVIDNNECRNYYKKIGDAATAVQFSDRIICAGIHRGKSTCTGDSGGPLVLPVADNGTFPYYLIGLVSYAEGCARLNLPTVYTNISYHMDWIQKKLDE